MKKNDKWLEWAVEIQAIAQTGLFYSQIDYDIERFERLREISIEMLEYKTEISKEKIRNIFASETGYQTPKIATKAAIFKGDKVLLVQENTGEWTLPGGWCDVNQSIANNTLKEIKEEAGVDAEIDYIVALHYVDSSKGKVDALKIVEVYVKCNYLSGEFVENIETLDSGYFTYEETQNMKLCKLGKEQLKMCFESINIKNWKTIVD